MFLKEAKEIAEMGESLDVAAIDIKEATEMLGNITGKNAKIKILIIPTNEELVIARETVELL